MLTRIWLLNTTRASILLLKNLDKSCKGICIRHKAQKLSGIGCFESIPGDLKEMYFWIGSNIPSSRKLKNQYEFGFSCCVASD